MSRFCLSSRSVTVVTVMTALIILAGIASTMSVWAEMTADAGGVLVTTELNLVSGGDANANGLIDAGDQVTIHFAINNEGNTEYPFATLRTGIERSILHGIWNVQGVSGLTLDDNTVTFPNIWIGAREHIDIFADATVDIFTDGEKTIFLTPQLFDRDGNPIPLPSEGSVIGKWIANIEQRVGNWTGELPSMSHGEVDSSFSSSASSQSTSAFEYSSSVASFISSLPASAGATSSAASSDGAIPFADSSSAASVSTVSSTSSASINVPLPDVQPMPDMTPAEFQQPRESAANTVAR